MSADLRLCSLCGETIYRDSPDIVILCEAKGKRGDGKATVLDKAGRVHLLQTKLISEKRIGVNAQEKQQ
jgi:hypothetical protein